MITNTFILRKRHESCLTFRICTSYTTDIYQLITKKKFEQKKLQHKDLSKNETCIGGYNTYRDIVVLPNSTTLIKLINHTAGL